MSAGRWTVVISDWVWLWASAITALLTVGRTRMPMLDGWTSGSFSSWRYGWRGRNKFSCMTWWVSYRCCCCYSMLLMLQEETQNTNRSCSEYKHSLKFHVQRYVITTTKPVHRLQIRPNSAQLVQRVAQPFSSHATLFPNRALLDSVQLCCKNAESWLVSSLCSGTV